MKFLTDYVLLKEVIQPLFIILGSIVLYVIISKMFKHLSKKTEDKKRKTILTVSKSVTKYIILALAVLLILGVYGIDTKAILASFGVIGAVLGFAMQDLLKDIIAGISILFEDQFRVGDYIEVGGFKGEVISLGLKTTRIKAYTGETKIISNRTLSEVINFNLQNSMAIVDVSVSYESDLQMVEQVLLDLCKKESKEISVLKGEVELLGIQSLTDNGITYRIVAPTRSMEQYGVERILRKQIKQAFDQNHITIPYRQVVVHNERV